ncbi:MAG TPA: aminotransferase class III-fold pyridoxal phosphate-dependent enzyme, partial [Anaerolineae bacterium]|nr:aminotransferase class III-fold pyridoxal phosphate-dependent enzyme [Anaerolineae bacterium]
MAPKENIAGELSTIIFNLAEIENFDPNIPLSELNLDPMELIEALRAEFGVGIEEDQLLETSTTLDSLTNYYEDILQDAHQPPAANNPPATPSNFAELDHKTPMLAPSHQQQSIAELQNELLTAVANDPDNPIATLVQQQLVMMRQQLEMLKQASANRPITKEVSAESPSPTTPVHPVTPPENEGTQITDLNIETMEIQLTTSEQELDILDAVAALEASLDTDEKTQILLPEIGNGIDPESRPQGDDLSGEQDDKTQLLIPTPPEDSNSNFPDVGTIITHIDSVSDDVTQLLAPPVNFSEPDSPLRPVEAPVEHDAPTRIFVRDIDGIRINEDDPFRDALLEQAAAVSTGRSATAHEDATQIIFAPQTEAAVPASPSSDSEDVTQIFSFEQQDSGEHAVESATVSPVDSHEAATQIFLPDTEEGTHFAEAAALIEEAASAELTPDSQADVTQIFLPQSDEGTQITEGTALIEEAASAELTPDSQADVTQIFLPQSDEGTQITEGTALIEEPSTAEMLANTFGDATPIFAPATNEDTFHDLAEPTHISNADILPDSHSDATQIFWDHIDDPIDFGQIHDDGTQILAATPQRSSAFIDEETALHTEDEQPFDDLFPILNEEDHNDIAGSAKENRSVEQVPQPPTPPAAPAASEPIADNQPVAMSTDELAYPSSTANAPHYEQPARASTHLGTFELAADAHNLQLSARQRAHLAALITKVTRKTAKSRAYAEQYRPFQADPQSAEFFHDAWRQINYPIVAARSKGSRIWDIDSNEYIDITLGGGAHLLGHAPQFVNKAIAAELSKGHELAIQNRFSGIVAKTICT